ncbi:TRAFs-binding domain-containing protein [Tenacibaculum ovolyticum]|uniref:TRAFs-binding domain-containing protein n=1 Tax=Tenacibaculum ovolyticum TaxID=104270 RepID=UPI0007EDEB69|nr:TRAFs-binding domain-containing protein [Tenacibaculum ovolyticum]
MKKTCFVIIGYGIKTDFANGRDINLDKTFNNIIKPIFEELDIECFRSSDLKQTGVIDVKMFEHIYKADFVVADISTLNANAIYELGIRHALRPNTTIVISEDDLLKEKRIPFDINHVAIHAYEHYGKGIDFDEVVRFKKYLKELVTHILDNPNEESDSPVYTFLPKLTPPTFSEEEYEELIENIDSSESISNLVELAEAEKNKKNHTEAIRLLTEALKNTYNQHDVFIIQRLALNTYKSEKPNKAAALFKAQDLLQTLNPEETTNPETLGLLGAINKRLFEILKTEEYLNQSLHFYERGYYVKQDYYNGINTAYLYITKALTSKENQADSLSIYASYGQAIKIWKEIIDKWEKITTSEDFEKRGDKEWICLTLAEAYLGIYNSKKEEKYLKLVSNFPDSDFAMSTYNEQKNKLYFMLEKLKEIQL